MSEFTVLLVDDDADVRDMIAALLSKSYYLLLAASGGEAVQIVADWQIDLLLTDILMPSMNGFDLADRAVSMRPGLRVLYMTGYFDPTGDAARARHGKLITKPFKPV